MAVYNEKNEKKWTKDKRHYYYRCYYTDMYGNRKQKVSKMYKSSHEAKDAEDAFLRAILLSDETDSNITFERVFYEWLDYKKNQVKSSTYYGFKRRVNKYILEAFKKYKLHSIKTNVIMEWNRQLFNMTDISLKYKNRVVSEMKEFLKYAEQNYDFDIKIGAKLQKKKLEKTIKEKDSETNFWTYDDFKEFIANVDDEYYYLIFSFLYFTGLRYGEFAALKWNDINFDKKTLRIDETLTTKVDGTDYILTDPKSKNSDRTIYLDDKLIKLLKEHYESEKNIYGFNDNYFIFGSVKYTSLTTLARKLDIYTKISNVKRITPHGLRHSHVSLLIHLGCDSREVAERIGDTPSMVESTYYHMFPEKKEHTINVLNNLIKNNNF